MDYSTPAFTVHAPAVTRLRVSHLACPCICSSTFSRRSLPAVSTRSRLLRMQAEPEPAPTEEPVATTDATQNDDSDVTNSATDILKTLRDESAADNTPSKRSMLGVYRDVDGKSNVWAVEPQEETDTRPQISKTTIIIAAASFIVLALLILPLLPFTNADQF